MLTVKSDRADSDGEGGADEGTHTHTHKHTHICVCVYLYAQRNTDIHTNRSWKRSFLTRFFSIRGRMPEKS